MATKDDFLSWSEIYYLVADRVATDDPVLPKEVVLSYLQRACSEICRKSSALREHIYIDIQCGVTDYPIELDDSYQVVSVLEATNNGCAMEPVNPRLEMRGTDNGYFMDDGWFYMQGCPQEDCCNGLKVLVSKAPGRRSCGVPEAFAEKHAEAIAAFVMWKIHSTRGLLYDPSLASKEYRLFNSYISDAEEDAETGSTNYHDYNRTQRLFGKGRRRVR